MLNFFSFVEVIYKMTFSCPDSDHFNLFKESKIGEEAFSDCQRKVNRFIYTHPESFLSSFSAGK